MAQRRWHYVLVASAGLAVLMILVLMLTRGRHLSLMLACGARLQSVATSAKIYASALPTWPNVTSQDRIVALIQAGHLRPDQTICPASKTPYVLLPLPDPAINVDPGRVIAHETGANHGQPGGNVAYADGHVDFEREPMTFSP